MTKEQFESSPLVDKIEEINRKLKENPKNPKILGVFDFSEILQIYRRNNNKQ